MTVALAALLAAGPEGLAADPPGTKGTIRIGLLNATSGPYESLGSDANAGFQYFLATHGDQLGGFAVELRTGNEGDSTTAAIAVAHQLVEQDTVDAIVGVDNSDDAYAIADYLDAQKKPIIITAAGADELTQDRARKNLFRVAHTSSQDTMPLGDYACRKLQKHTAAIFGSDYSYGWESAGGFARAYTAAGCRIVEEQYVPRDGDWGATIEKTDRSATIVFVAADPTNAVKVVEAYRAAHLAIPLLGDATLTNEPYLADERENALGVITASHYSTVIHSTDNETFRRGFETLDGRSVSEYVENGYVAAEILSNALARLPSGPPKADALVAQMRTVAVDAPRGPVRFDAYQQVVNAVYIRRVVQLGGRFRNSIVTMYPLSSQFWRYDPEKYLQLPTYAKLKGTWARQ